MKKCIDCDKEFEAGNRAMRCQECQEAYRKEYKRQKNNEWAKNNPEKANKWRKENPEGAKEIQKRWVKKNQEKIKEIQKRWRKKNPEKVKEIRKKWAKNNPEKVREKKNKWKQNNPDKWHLSHSKSMSKRRGRGFIPITDVPDDVKNHTCGYEWKHFHRDTDYVIAVPRIGSSGQPKAYAHDLDNLIINHYGYLEHYNPKLWTKIDSIRKEALIKNKQTATIIRHKKYIKQKEYPYHTFIEIEEEVIWE